MSKNNNNVIMFTLGAAFSAAFGYCIYKFYRHYSSDSNTSKGNYLNPSREEVDLLKNQITALGGRLQQQEEINKYFAQLHLLNGLRVDEVLVTVYEEESGNPSLPYERQENLERLAQDRLAKAILLAYEMRSPELRLSLETITKDFVEEHRASVMGSIIFDESPVSLDCYGDN